MSGSQNPGDSGAFEFEKVTLNDARKALEETGPAGYTVKRKTENWDEKRHATGPEPLSDAATAWVSDTAGIGEAQAAGAALRPPRQSPLRDLDGSCALRAPARRADDGPSRRPPGISARRRQRARDASRSLFPPASQRPVGVGARRTGALTRRPGPPSSRGSRVTASGGQKANNPIRSPIAGRFCGT